MKFFVASDIHGDSYWAKRVIDAFTESKADKLVLLGDILYHGPRNDLPAHYEPKKVIELLNAIADKIIAVRGNCDTEVDQMVLKFPIMADYITCCQRHYVQSRRRQDFPLYESRLPFHSEGRHKAVLHHHRERQSHTDSFRIKGIIPKAYCLLPDPSSPFQSTCLFRHCSTGGSHHTYNRCNSPGPVLLSGYPCLRPYQLL